MLREREFIRLNETTYKIGRTCRKYDKRIDEYPNDSEILTIISVTNCKKAEREIIETFKVKFKQKKEYGHEYFYGSAKEMMEELFNICKKYLSDDLYENNTIENNNRIIKDRISNEELIKKINEGDEGLAELVYQKYRGKIIIIDEKKGYFWNESTKLWKEGKLSLFINMIADYLLEEIKKLHNLFKLKHEKYQKYDTIKTAKIVEFINKIECILVKLAKPDGKLEIWNLGRLHYKDLDNTKRKMNRQKGLVPIKNLLIVDLKTGITRERIYTDYFTFYCPVNIVKNIDSRIIDFFSQTACHRVCLQNYLQELMGYMITNETIENKFFEWRGTGNSNKSIIAKLLQKIFPEYCNIIDMTIKSKKIHKMLQNNESEKYIHRFGFIVDSFNDNEDIYSMNHLYCSNIMNVRSYCNYQDFQHKIIRNVMVYDTSSVYQRVNCNYAVLREKLLILPFDCLSVIGNIKQIETILDENFIAHMQENLLDDIFTYICTGAKRWYERGCLPQCEHVFNTTQELFDEVDSIKQFVQDMIIPAPNEKLGVGIVNTRYRKWVDELNQKTIDKSFHAAKQPQGILAKRLRELLGNSKLIGGSNFFLNWALKS